MSRNSYFNTVKLLVTVLILLGAASVGKVPTVATPIAHAQSASCGGFQDGAVNGGSIMTANWYEFDQSPGGYQGSCASWCTQKTKDITSNSLCNAGYTAASGGGGTYGGAQYRCGIYSQYNSTSNYAYSNGSGGPPGTQQITTYYDQHASCIYTPASQPQPSASLSANPSSILDGRSSTLSWSSSNATSCTGTNGLSTGGATSGSVSVSPETTTNYSVSCSGAGGSASSNATVNVSTISPPTGLSMSCNSAGNQATFRWNSVSGADNYYFRTQPSGGSENDVNGFGGTSITLNVTPGQAYDWWVHANIGDGSSNYGANHFSSAANGNGFTCNPPAPTAPPSPSYMNYSCNAAGNQVTMSWPSTSGATEYHARLGNLDNNTQPYSSDNIGNTTSIVYSINPGTNYRGWVHAVNSGGWSNATYSSDFNCPPPTPQAPAAPSYVNASCSTDGSHVTMSWNSVPNANAYHTRLGYYGGSQITSDDVGNVTSQYLSITPGTQYHFWVHADNSGQWSASTDSGAFTCNAPSKPDLTADSGGDVNIKTGSKATFAGSVSNIGAGSVSGSFNSRYEIYSGPGVGLERVVVSTNSLGAGSTKSAVGTTNTVFNSVGNYQFRLCVDSDANDNGTVSESNEGNNCGSWQYINVTAATVPPPAPPTGLQATCNATSDHATLSWNAVSGAQNYYIRMHDNTANADPNWQGGYTGTSISEPITAGHSYSWWIHSNIGDGSTNYSNNNFSAQTNGPDFTCNGQPNLTAGSVSPTSATAGSSVTLNATASNAPAPAGTSASFPVLFQIATSVSNPAGTIINQTDSSYLSGLPPSGTGTGSINYTFPSAGTYAVRACANENTSGTFIATESNYGDNCGSWTTINVSNPVTAPTPSLSCSASPSSVTVGQSATYSASGASAPYTWIPSDGVGSYGTGATATRTFTSTGTYGMSVSKSGYTSATCTPNVQVGSAGCSGPASVSITATPDLVKSGTAVTISWTASNVPTGVSTCTVTGPSVSQTLTVGSAPTCAIPNGSANPTITDKSVYTINCGGTTATAIVNIVPTFKEF